MSSFCIYCSADKGGGWQLFEAVEYGGCEAGQCHTKGGQEGKISHPWSIRQRNIGCVCVCVCRLCLRQCILTLMNTVDSGSCWPILKKLTTIYVILIMLGLHRCFPFVISLFRWTTCIYTDMYPQPPMSHFGRLNKTLSWNINNYRLFILLVQVLKRKRNIFAAHAQFLQPKWKCNSRM